MSAWVDHSGRVIVHIRLRGRVLREIQRQTIRAVLRAKRGNVTRAAQALGVSRQSLQRMVKL